MPVSVYFHRVHAFFSFYDAVLHVCKHLKVRLQMYRYGEAHTPCLEQGVGPSPWTHCWWNLLLMRDRTYRLCRRLTVPVALLARCGGEGSVSCILWKARTCTLGASCSHVFSCRTTMRWRWGIKVKWWFWGYSGKTMYAFQTCPDCSQFWLVFNHCTPIVYPCVLSHSFSPLLLGAEHSDSMALSCAHQDHELGISGIQLHGGVRNHFDGTLRLGCTQGQRVPLGDLLPYLDPHKYFFLTFAEKQFNKSLKNALYVHKEKSLLARFLHTASYLHYKCHKHVLESVSFIFSRWQKNSSLQLFLNTYFFLNNGDLLKNDASKQIMPNKWLSLTLYHFNWLPKSWRVINFAAGSDFLCLMVYLKVMKVL